jgi:hypothetical protein
MVINGVIPVSPVAPVGPVAPVAPSFILSFSHSSFSHFLILSFFTLPFIVPDVDVGDSLGIKAARIIRI